MLSRITKLIYGNPKEVTTQEQIINSYNKCKAWVKSNYDDIYLKISETEALKNLKLPSLNESKNFFWDNKEIFVGGTILFCGLIILNLYRNNRNIAPVNKIQTQQNTTLQKINPIFPQHDQDPLKPVAHQTTSLIAHLKTSLNFAKLKIKTPKIQVPPLNVSLTFCIDTSTSMAKIDRINSIKKGIYDVLENVQKIINDRQNAKIKISIVQFNNHAKVVTEPTEIVYQEDLFGKNSAVHSIRSAVEKLNASGGTNIINGLNLATIKLESMSKNNTEGKHTMILLTDGEESLDSQMITPIQEKLAKIGAKFFAIGIGQEHQKMTLEQIANSKIIGFEGSYIDTTNGFDTIENAISNIYNNAVAIYRDFELTSKNLKAGSWSVNTQFSIAKNNLSTCKLDDLNENTNVTRSIQIHCNKLDESIDLSTVEFDLAYKDPLNNKHQISLPWHLNSIINPKIVRTLHAH